VGGGNSRETAFDLHGSGPGVVLVHGLGLNRLMWQWQLPALTNHFSVLTYDLLGHGESAKPHGVVDLAMFSGQLQRVMDACALERAAIVGFSLGGMIARRFALDHPDRLWAMAVLHSPHDRTPSQREAVLQRARQVKASGPSATVDAALERWFTPSFRATHADVMELVRAWILANDPTIYPKVYKVLAEGDAELADSIDGISCPTLVMTGDQDVGNSPEMARKMATRIPDARVEILPGLRHMGLAESPSAVNALLLAFLLDVQNRRG
jgi:(E)-2-((N-methylformamido)methylene)succinate hydrolase